MYLRWWGTNKDGKSVRAARSQSARGILAIRVDIVVGEGISPSINLKGVYEAAVVVGGVHSVVLRRADTRLDVAAGDQEGRSDKGSTETGDNSGVDGVVTALDGEWSAVAAPDITSSRLGIAAVVAAAVESAAGNLAVDVANALGVDGQGVVGVLVPDLVDIGAPVVLESGGVDNVVVVGRESADGSSRRVGNAHGAPWVAIRVTLLDEAIADLADGGRAETLGNLSAATIVDGQGHAKDHADKVNIADVCVNSQARSVGQLDESPVNARTRIREVGGRRLNQTVTVGNLDHEELEVALREVDSSRSDDNGHSDGNGVALGRQRNGNVAADGNRDTGASGARVDQAAIGGNEHDLVVRVKAGDVGVDLVTAEAVDELDWQTAPKSAGVNGVLVHSCRGRTVESSVESVVRGDDDILGVTGLGDAEWRLCSGDERRSG